MTIVCEDQTEAVLDGRYRLRECVGRGATAAVHRAEDTVLGRTVAIKLLHPADGTPTSTERVHTESAVLASLNHPSLVTLYDARLDPAHPRYLAMEFVDGPTLAARLSHGPLTSPEARLLAGELAGALQVVHDAGIIHRDVKPSNVLLAPPLRPSAPWTPKLTDFGIAYGLDDARVTSPGVVIGTAAYMAPEQVRSEPLTPAVDVYALGLVLIEALTGTPPFPLAGGVQTALRRLTSPPEIPEELGPEWVALLTRMTSTEPEARPAAHEVARAAAAWGSSEAAGPLAPAPAREIAPPRDAPTATTRAYTAALRRSRRRRQRRRRGALVASGLVASLTVIAGVWVGTAGAGGPDPAREATIGTFAPPSDAVTTGVEEPAAPTTDVSSTEVSSTEVSSTEVSTTDARPVVGERADSSSGPGPSDQKPSNPNKGPGNNSGKSDQASNKGKGD